MFEKLVPGCNGVLHESDFRGNKISIDNYRDVLKYAGKIMEEADGINQPPPPNGAPPSWPGDEDSKFEGGGDGHPHHHHSHAQDEL